MDCHIGDAAFAKLFRKTQRNSDGLQISANFAPPKGKEFVVLLIGEVDAGTVYADPDVMLNALGYFKKPNGADAEVKV
jgi:hypothetical protein